MGTIITAPKQDNGVKIAFKGTMRHWIISEMKRRDCSFGRVVKDCVNAARGCNDGYDHV